MPAARGPRPATEKDTYMYIHMKSSRMLPYGGGPVNTSICFLPASFHVCRHTFSILLPYCLYNFLLLFSPNFISLDISPTNYKQFADTLCSAYSILLPR